MRRIYLFILFSTFIIAQSFSQSNDGKIIHKDSTDVKSTDIIKENNTWAIGGGFSNFIMHGDLRSIGVYDDSNYWNFGGYVYVDKMFNPILGLEFKATYTKMSGGVQSFSNGYSLRYVPNNIISDSDLRFEGRSYGAELNLIVSFSNLFKRDTRKWNIAGYFGVGYHQYDSALYKTDPTGTTPDELLVDFGYNPDRNSVNEASSIFLSTQLGIKRRLSRRVDLEFRTGMYFNNEDHLDAAVSDKQTWESFFVTSLGVVLKLGKKKEYIIWVKDPAPGEEFKIIDTDNDGVMDQLDVEPNTPKGAMVYGNGQAVDADKDGLPDYKDKCPLEYGPISNEGCPLNVDTDGDGVMDGKDLCPNTPGPVENRGCPKQEVVPPVNITQQIGLLATSIYFDTNSDKIKLISYSTIDQIIMLMKKIPDVKFVIEGHTDDRNSDKYNLYLSQRRAESVRKYMIKQGIVNDRLKPKGYGESRPKFSNANAGGRQLNRRVEIKPIDAIGPVERIDE
ncbi:OmpA family protein [Polaribacter staleyi]|uniref:OmpA family protein n=1 Tax=Polaribacter staleyi TaxID=2022337 RepID=UPI0031BB1AA7